MIFLKVEERAAARAEYKRSLQVQKEFEIRLGLLILIKPAREARGPERPAR